MTNLDLREDVYIYGIDKLYNITGLRILRTENKTLDEIRRQAYGLAGRYPHTYRIFAVNSNLDIRDSYRDVRRKNWIEDRVVLKLLLEQYGMEFPA